MRKSIISAGGLPEMMDKFRRTAEPSGNYDVMQ